MLLMLPASVCLALLVVHSLYFRPFRATAVIFAFAIPASMLYGGKDFYIFNIASPTIPLFGFIDAYPVPIVNIVGFVFTFYCAISLAVHLLERPDESGHRVAPLFWIVAVAVYISALVGLAIEYTNLAAKWWNWSIEVEYAAITGVAQWFGVWSWRSILIFPILLQFFVVRTQSVRRTIAYCIAWFVVFLTWMVVVDRIWQAVLRPLAVALWLLLPLFGRYFLHPVVALDRLQFNRPVAVLPRLGWRASLAIAPAKSATQTVGRRTASWDGGFFALMPEVTIFVFLTVCVVAVTRAGGPYLYLLWLVPMFAVNVFAILRYYGKSLNVNWKPVIRFGVTVLFFAVSVFVTIALFGAAVDMGKYFGWWDIAGISSSDEEGFFDWLVNFGPVSLQILSISVAATLFFISHRISGRVVSKDRRGIGRSALRRP